MMFRSRTVIAIVLFVALASSALTLTFLDPDKSPGLLQSNNSTSGSHDNKQNFYKWADGMTEQEMMKVSTSFRIISEAYMSDIKRNKLIDGAIHGMLSALDDPYSVYMDVEQSQEFSKEVDSYFTGIGAEVTTENGNIVVVSPIKGSPADRAGILPKDIILSVNGDSLQGLKVSEAIERIRGPKGTKAKLKVVRGVTQNPIEIEVIRDAIELETVFSEVMAGNIGKIEIRQFSVHTAERFAAQLADLEKKGIKGLIIDVRNNPGGYLKGVLQIIEPFIPKDKVMIQYEYRDGNKQQVKSKSESISGKPYPIAVLINQGSASASEILAAAIKQSAGGKLIGEKSFGKGTVQSQYESEFKDGSNIKLSIAKWLTPNGTWVHKQGIEPDIKVDQPHYFTSVPLPRDRELKYDEVSEEVKNLQVILSGLGFDPGRMDGYFSTQTEAVVKQFQSSQKLQDTGIVDAETADALEAALINLFNADHDLQLQAALKYLQNR